jgi:hypothetical protein
MDQDKMINLIIGPSYQVSIHLATVSEEKILKINQSETRIACGGHVCKRIRAKCAIFIENLP